MTFTVPQEGERVEALLSRAKCNIAYADLHSADGAKSPKGNDVVRLTEIELTTGRGWIVA